MKKLFIAVSLLIILLVVGGCGSSAGKNRSVVEVAGTFLFNMVKADYPALYADLSDDSKQDLTLDQVEQALKKEEETRGKISKASFDYYQKTPDQKAFLVFFNADYQGGKTGSYCFIVGGNPDDGYKVISFGVNEKALSIAGEKMGSNVFMEITPKGINVNGKR